MDIQQQIIALVQGDIREPAQAQHLMNLLAESTDRVTLLLDQIALNRTFSGLRKEIPSNAESTFQPLQQQIAQFESGHKELLAGTAVATVIEPQEKSSPSLSLNQSILLATVLTALSLWIGYLLGTGDTPPVESSEPSSEVLIAPPQTGPSAHPDEKGTLPISPPAREQRQQADEDKESRRTEGVISPANQQPYTAPEQLTSSTSISTPALHFTGPAMGDQFHIGDMLPINWSGKDADSPTLLQISSDGGNYWKNIAPAIQGGATEWRISREMPPSNQYMVRLRSYTSDNRNALTPKIFSPHKDRITLDLSPDGKYLATGGRDSTLLIEDVATGRLLHRITGYQGSIQSIRFSPDGSRIVTSALDGTAMIWDRETGEQELTLKGDKGDLVWHADFTPDGKMVATGHDEGTIILWDAERGEELFRMHPHEEAVRYFIFSADGKQLLTTSSDRTATITNMITRQVVQRFDHQPYDLFASELNSAQSATEAREAYRRKVVNTITMTHDGSIVMTGGYNGLVKTWNVRSGELLRSEVYNDGKEIVSLKTSRDGAITAVMGTDGMTTLIDSYTGELINHMEYKVGDSVISVSNGAFSPDASALFISHMNGEVSWWNIWKEGTTSDPFMILE